METWIQANPTSGKGNSDVDITLQENIEEEEREAVVNIKTANNISKELIIKQLGLMKTYIIDLEGAQGPKPSLTINNVGIASFPSQEYTASDPEFTTLVDFTYNYLFAINQEGIGFNANLTAAKAFAGVMHRDNDSGGLDYVGRVEVSGTTDNLNCWFYSADETYAAKLIVKISEEPGGVASVQIVSLGLANIEEDYTENKYQIVSDTYNVWQDANITFRKNGTIIGWSGFYTDVHSLVVNGNFTNLELVCPAEDSENTTMIIIKPLKIESKSLGSGIDVSYINPATGETMLFTMDDSNMCDSAVEFASGGGFNSVRLYINTGGILIPAGCYINNAACLSMSDLYSKLYTLLRTVNEGKVTVCTVYCDSTNSEYPASLAIVQENNVNVIRIWYTDILDNFQQKVYSIRSGLQSHSNAGPAKSYQVNCDMSSIATGAQSDPNLSNYYINGIENSLEDFTAALKLDLNNNRAPSVLVNVTSDYGCITTAKDAPDVTTLYGEFVGISALNNRGVAYDVESGKCTIQSLN